VVTICPSLKRAPGENAYWARWLATILRIHLLLQWDDLGDPAKEDVLIEVQRMRRFVGISMISDRIPDETTNLTFQHLLEKHNHGEQIFEVVKARMCRRHLTERKKREPEMNQTCRGKLWNHAAYVHDPAAAADLMHGEKSCFATISIRDPGWSLIEPLGRRP
jgi:IS5 family transposase